MADATPSTTAPDDQDERLVEFQDAANMDFEAVDFDLAALPSARQLDNSFMVSVRIAAVCLTKTKGELIDVVTKLGCDRDDGGDLPQMIDGMRDAETGFASFVELLQSAMARLFIASCAATQG